MYLDSTHVTVFKLDNFSVGYITIFYDLKKKRVVSVDSVVAKKLQGKIPQLIGESLAFLNF